jgi:hypothetical protein
MGRTPVKNEMRFDLSESSESIKARANEAFGKLLDCQIKLVITAYVSGGGHLKKTRGLFRIFQEVLRSGKGVIWNENSRICELYITKEHGEVDLIVVDVGVLGNKGVSDD